jgi:nitroreductase
MDLFEAINQRRCIRSYTQREVTDDEIKTLLQMAVRAPSGGNRQTWRFVVVRDPEAIESYLLNNSGQLYCSRAFHSALARRGMETSATSPDFLRRYL